MEHQIADLDRRIETFKPINVATTLEEIRDFVSRNILNLRDLLHQDESRAKAALSRHIGQLTLTPRTDLNRLHLRGVGQSKPAESRCNAGGGQGRNRSPYGH